MQTFRDRRVVAAPRTREELRDHLQQHHGAQTGSRMHVNDLHDAHDAMHEMPTTHGHD